MKLSELLYETTDNIGLSTPRKVIAYHGGSVPIRKFDASKTVDGNFWFSEDKDKILRGESGANSTKVLMTCELTVEKTAGWDEYDKYFYEQLINMGYDSINLDSDWIMFDPNRIKVLKIERTP